MFKLEIEDYRFAHIVSTLANIHRGKDKEAYKVKDFVPDRRGAKTKEQQKRQTVAEQMELAKQITLAFGGRVIEKLKTVPKK